jgi:hypothetical protein
MIEPTKGKGSQERISAFSSRAMRSFNPSQGSNAEVGFTGPELSLHRALSMGRDLSGRAVVVVDDVLFPSANLSHQDRVSAILQDALDIANDESLQACLVDMMVCSGMNDNRNVNSQ